jgi:outer membrane biosynthesis protein TonB
VDATAVDRRDETAGVRSGLAVSEWAVVGAAGIFLLSLTAFDWFAFSVEGRAAPGTEGDAFRWLDGFDYVLLAAGLLAAAAPLARFAGMNGATPHAVALVTGSAGLLAALVITYLIASPPDANTNLLGAVGGGPLTETIARGGAVIGLAAALAIAALSGLTLLASPAALAPVPRPRVATTPAHPEASPVERPRPIAPAPAPQPTPKPEPRRPAAKSKPKPAAPQRSARPKPKPAAPKRRTKPKTAARKRTTTQQSRAKPRPKRKPPARPRLTTATAADLAGVGFTPAQAQRIVEYRDDLGKVTKLSDLKRVPGIAKPVLVELVKRLDE